MLKAGFVATDVISNAGIVHAASHPIKAALSIIQCTVSEADILPARAF
jgi:hypothetical protein